LRHVFRYRQRTWGFTRKQTTSFEHEWIVRALATRRKREARSARAGGVKFGEKNFAYKRGVSLTGRKLHHLAFEEVQGGGVTGTKIRDGLWMSGDDLFAQLFQGAAVAELCKAFSVTTAIADIPRANISAKTSFACRPLIRPSSIRVTNSWPREEAGIA
jgi:hypothetical protein